MNELERTALNEILRTVTYIAEKVDELDSKISLNDSQVPLVPYMMRFCDFKTC